MRYILFLSFIISITSCQRQYSLAEPFQKNGVTGTIYIQTLDKSREYYYNISRSKQQYLPGSTFKIVNTLIALNEAAVKDQHEVISWNGFDYGFKVWNKDQSISTAFPLSCLWFYEELAKRIGKEKYGFYLKAMRYGNMKGGGADPFWLRGDLSISAQEQVEVLRNIINSNYRFQDAHYDILKELMIVKKGANYTLYGKSGWVTSTTPAIGWFVGYLESENKIYIYALNIDTKNREDLGKRQLIVEQIFEKLKLLE